MVPCLAGRVAQIGNEANATVEGAVALLSNTTITSIKSPRSGDDMCIARTSVRGYQGGEDISVRPGGAA